MPKTLGEAGPADQMMWEWKNQGKNWEEIRAEWKKITGVEPGGSSLSVRYIKLVENLARNGAAGVSPADIFWLIDIPLMLSRILNCFASERKLKRSCYLSSGLESQKRW